MLEKMLKELMDEIGDDIDTPTFVFQIEPEKEFIWVTIFNPQGDALQKFKLHCTLEEVPVEQ